MMEWREETTLARVRLHWGIFIPALLVGFVPILPDVASHIAGPRNV
jgi:hypothetical protein